MWMTVGGVSTYSTPFGAGGSRRRSVFNVLLGQNATLSSHASKRPRVTDDSRAVVVGGFLAIVAGSGLLGAALGYALPARTGLEEVTVLSIAFAVTPASVALYGVVGVGTFLATLLAVVLVVERFDEAAG